MICVYCRLTLWTTCIVNSATVRCNAVYCSVCAWFKQSYSLYDSSTEWNWEIHSHIVWCNFPRQIIIYFHFKQTKRLLVQISPICQGRYGLFDSGMKRYDEICSSRADVNFNDQCCYLLQQSARNQGGYIIICFWSLYYVKPHDFSILVSYPRWWKVENHLSKCRK